MRLYFYLISFLLFAGQTPLIAQPLHFHQYGCKYVKNKLHKHSLSDSQRSSLTQVDTRSDSVDILHYNVTLDVSNYGAASVFGDCEVSFTPKVDGISEIVLDLLALEVDSITYEGQNLMYGRDTSYIYIDLGNTLNLDDTAKLHVFYHGKPVADPASFGGLVFEDNIIYNLGIGLSGLPDKYNYGRGWFPCFDNFVERATYDLNIITNSNLRAYCIGTFIEEQDLGNKKLWRYSMQQPLPTYLVGIAAGNYRDANLVHEGVYGSVPIKLVAHPNDTTNMKTSFQYLGQSIDAFEDWFGPYFWEYAGFVLTSAGAMEHSTLVAYPRFIGVGGATFANNRLMAHELAHHWWGNMLTLSSPSNMWIKEGNAEYSAHLFTEFVFGKEEFIEQVKDNFEEVIERAHIDDDGFHPLSGIIYEQTYGTHTYNKGASMMHNLRGYLGDELFSSGMTAMLDHFLYQSIDAYQFRDFLSGETGVDLTSFFDDWIFNPGYSNFEIENVETVPVGNGNHQVTVVVQQKLRAAPQLHTNVPLSISFFDENWQPNTQDFMASGEFTQVVFTLPFEPVLQVLNDDHKLNLGRLQNRFVVKEPGNQSTKFTRLSLFDVDAITESDSALVNVVHHYVAPDPMMNTSSHYQLSNSHYWTISGVLPDEFDARVRFSYNGSDDYDLDYDLVSTTEDSIILLWRPNPQTDWVEYPFYEKQLIGSNNGFGFLTAQPIQLGDYCFANGITTVLSNEDITKNIEVSVFPNPTTERFTIRLKDIPSSEVQIEFFDLFGKRLINEVLNVNSPEMQYPVEVQNFASGTYTLRITDSDGMAIHTEKVVIQ